LKKILILLLILLYTNIYAEDIFGSWAFLGYDWDDRVNQIDVITIIDIDETNAIVQHSFYLKKQDDYLISAKIEDGKILYKDPITEWDVILELNSRGNILTWHSGTKTETEKSSVPLQRLSICPLSIDSSCF